MGRLFEMSDFPLIKSASEVSLRQIPIAAPGIEYLFISVSMKHPIRCTIATELWDAALSALYAEIQMQKRIAKPDLLNVALDMGAPISQPIKTAPEEEIFPARVLSV